mmetsp:Transcript_50676/g.108562  ORF Transcript_50676/g.108562 Transcript_50676/m.108562 type:complete len:85 (+) Transcript_50676:214-468(+)
MPFYNYGARRSSQPSYLACNWEKSFSKAVHCEEYFLWALVFDVGAAVLADFTLRFQALGEGRLRKPLLSCFGESPRALLKVLWA